MIERRVVADDLREQFPDMVAVLKMHDPVPAPAGPGDYGGVAREIFSALPRVRNALDFESCVYDSFWHHFGYYAGPKQRYRSLSRHLFAFVETRL